MKLEELIDYLIDLDKLKELYRERKFNLNSEGIIIYMRDKLDVQSEIIFFEMEETDDLLIFRKDGIEYIQLFPFTLAVDLIDSDLGLKNKGISNREIALRLLEYRKSDA